MQILPAILLDSFTQADAALRGESMADAAARPTGAAGRLTVVAVVASACYGAAMGSFAAVHGGPALQVAYSAIKTPMFLLVTFALTMPSYAVVSTLLGLRRDLPAAMAALLAGQVAIAITLLSFAPLLLFVYICADAYNAAVLFNGLIFALASLGAQRPLRRRFVPLLRRSRAHRWLLRVWLAVYVFTGVQMGWALRPFVGSPTASVVFYRGGEWDNAYVIVTKIIWRCIGG